MSTKQNLQYQFSADTDDFAAGARRVAGEVNKVTEAGLNMNARLGNYFKGLTGQMLGLFGAQQLLSKGLQQFEDAGAIAAKSKALQTTIERYQELNYTATQNEATMQDYEAALGKVNRTQLMALKGNEDLIKTYARLGVSFADLQSKSSIQIFDQIAAKQKGAEISTLLVGDATKVMGETADKVLIGMVEGFDDAAAAARRAGVVIKDEVILSLAAMGDRIDAAALRMKAAFAPVVDWLARSFLGISDAAQLLIGNVGAVAGGFMGTEGTFKEKLAGGSKAGMEFIDAVTNDLRKRDEDLARQLNDQGKGPAKAMIEDIGRNAADKAVKDETTRMGNTRTSVDSLTRIGGFRGGEADASLNLMRKQTSDLAKVARATEESAKHLKDLAG
jgi:hypothetical protein